MHAHDTGVLYMQLVYLEQDCSQVHSVSKGEALDTFLNKTIFLLIYNVVAIPENSVCIKICKRQFICIKWNCILDSNYYKQIVHLHGCEEHPKAMWSALLFFSWDSLVNLRKRRVSGLGPLNESRITLSPLPKSCGNQKLPKKFIKYDGGDSKTIVKTYCNAVDCLTISPKANSEYM